MKIRVENATKVYETKTGSVHALEDVSIEVHDGELVCILGPSGCGKTTLLWAMSGLHGLSRQFHMTVMNTQFVVYPKQAIISSPRFDLDFPPFRVKLGARYIRSALRHLRPQLALAAADRRRARAAAA